MEMSTFLPQGLLLSPEKVQQIDQTGRRILEGIGIKVLTSDNRFLDTLQAAGAEVDYENQMIRFGQDMMDELLGKAPSRFTLYSRDGKNDLRLGEGNVYIGNGGRVFRILDMATGGYRLTLLRDVANAAMLVNSLDNIPFYVIPGQAHDIKAVNYHLLDFYYALNYTTKHVLGGCDDLHGAQQMWDLVSIVAGGEDKFREKPFVSVMVNPISPLSMDENTLEILDFCVKHGVPVMWDPTPIAGATAPATLAGTLAQMHAEALAGIAISQVLAPGAKVAYGAVPTTMDLRNMEFSMGSVEMAMMNAAAVQLAKLYELPCYPTAGVTEAKRPDIQAGFEKSVSTLMVASAGGDMIHLTVGMLDSGNSISYEQFVMDNEFIGMIHHLLAGTKVDEGTLAFDVINSVGPRGNFIAEDHTIDHMMEEFFYPNLRVRCNFDIWEENGRPSMLIRAHEQVQDILMKGQEGLLDPDIISEIKKNFPGSRLL